DSLRGHDWRVWKLLHWGRGSIVFGRVVLALSKHIVLLLWHVGVERSKRLNGIVDAVETVPKMAEHFAACRSSRRCDIVYTDFLADQRHHLALPRARGVWQIADIDWQEIHRRIPSNWTAVTADQHLKFVRGRAGIPVGVPYRNPG